MTHPGRIEGGEVPAPVPGSPQLQGCSWTTLMVLNEGSAGPGRTMRPRG
jgi:hypothetical protein